MVDRNRLSKLPRYPNKRFLKAVSQHDRLFGVNQFAQLLQQFLFVLAIHGAHISTLRPNQNILALSSYAASGRIPEQLVSMSVIIAQQNDRTRDIDSNQSGSLAAIRANCQQLSQTAL